jgi:acyl carrier protein
VTTEIEHRILTFIRELAGGPDDADRSSVEPDTPLLDLGLIDSFNIVEITGFLEQNFEIHVPSEQLLRENFRSVRAICRLVVAAQAAL